MKKKAKIILIAGVGTAITISLAVAIPFSIWGIRSAIIDNDWSYLKNDDTYSQKVEISGLELVKQHISCGYATIEMLSSYYGNKVSEDDLDNKNKGAISTSSTNGFYKEINSSIPSKEFHKFTYLNNDVFLKEIHDSLADNNPVAIEWAAEFEGEWTLHFSVVSSLDIKNDNVQIYNPYGYIEDIHVNEFINRTTFKAFKNMPLFYGFGFAYGAFDKNALFHA